MVEKHADLLAEIPGDLETLQARQTEVLNRGYYLQFIASTNGGAMSDAHREEFEALHDEFVRLRYLAAELRKVAEKESGGADAS